MAKIFPPTLNTDVSGPNGNSSTAPGLARQRRRSPAAVTPASVPGGGPVGPLPSQHGSVRGRTRGRQAGGAAAPRSLRTRARNDLPRGASARERSRPPTRRASFGDDLGPFAAVAYIPLFALANFVVAWGILAGAGGLLFGTAVAWPLALAGVTLAALAQMAVARRLAKDHAGKLLPKRMRGLEDFLQQQRHGRGDGVADRARSCPTGWSTTPWGSPGSATARWRWAPSIGAAPKVFAYVALGGSINNLSAIEVKIAVAVLVVLGVFGLVVVRRRMARPRPRRLIAVERRLLPGGAPLLGRRGVHLHRAARGGDRRLRRDRRDDPRLDPRLRLDHALPARGPRGAPADASRGRCSRPPCHRSGRWAARSGLEYLARRRAPDAAAAGG